MIQVNNQIFQDGSSICHESVNNSLALIHVSVKHKIASLPFSMMRPQSGATICNHILKEICTRLIWNIFLHNVIFIGYFGVQIKLWLSHVANSDE